jgi:hypothetical protein
MITTVNAQDKIYLKSGENINAKILEVNLNDIKYKKYTNQEGPLYAILKDNIHMVIYENGETDFFKPNNPSEIGSPSLKQTKSTIIKITNNYCYSYENGKPIQVSFEGDFLRLKLTNKEKTVFVKDKGIYDFSNIYKFDKISFRDNQIAFLNIWVPNKKDNRWNKVKLVIKVIGHDNAKKIMEALKDYNNILINNRK